MKKLLLSLSLVAAFGTATAMEHPDHITDYIVKNTIASGMQKAKTSSEAVAYINQLLESNKQLSQAAESGDFDQYILDVALHAFSKTMVPFFKLKQGIGQRLSQEYFKNIRNYNSETDLSVIKNLLHDNWDVLIGKGTENTPANIDEQMNQVINKYTTKVICSGQNQAVGFITYACQRIFGECSIKFIAVDTPRNGYGKKLIEYAQYDAQNKKLPIMHLRVFQDNTSAINFYRSLGFTAINHNYHMPAFTMKKEI